MGFGGTEILARLSTGGMGEVLLGRRKGALGFEKLCALKTIRGDLLSRQDFRAMFLDEARLVARLDHPSIAQVYDFGEEGQTLYLAMEYVAGVPLSQLLKAGRAPFPLGIAARMIAEVLRGLHYAHDATDPSGAHLGVVHRDVSPQNLILTFDGRMKILDFGIAITKDREAPETAVGVLKGKPSYMAPEHLRGGGVDRRADVFSASVVLHELLTGQKLFTRETALATALAVEGDPIPAPSSLVPGLSPALDALVMRGLSRDPGDRFPDAKSMAEALEQVARVSEADTLGDYARRELAEESAAHQRWLNEVLDHAEKNGAIPEEEITGRIHPKPEQAPGLPGPPPEPRSSLAPPAPGSDRVSVPPQVSARPSWATPGEELPTQIKPAERGSSRWIAVIALLVAIAGAILLLARPEEPIPPLASAPPSPSPTATPEPSPTPVEVALPEGDAEESPTDPGRHRPRPTPTKRPRAEDPPAAPTGPPGAVIIGADPYANVRIDGALVGVTPLKKSLPPGPHEIELVSPDSGEVRWKKRVEVVSDETVRIKVP